jgi:dTDP-4-dehydrorhamnose 3,5-epimerase-like enzyme
MPSPNPIADVYCFALEPFKGGLTLLNDNQHLLRRFGQLKLRDLAAGQAQQIAFNEEADHFCFAIDGAVTVSLEDGRPGSPSEGARMETALEAGEPKGLLVPFGVACTVVSEEGARLLLLSTHAPAESPAA